MIKLTDGGADEDSFFVSGTPPASVSSLFLLPEDDPPLDPFAIYTSFILSADSNARVVIEGVRIGFSVPEPAAMCLFLVGALGFLGAYRGNLINVAA